MKLFNRTYEITIQNVRLHDLRVRFSCEKSVHYSPNRAEIEIYNLSAHTRRELEQATNRITVQIHAGYGGENALIFRGNLRDIRSTRDGADIITKISAGDGLRAIREARIARSFGPGTQLLEIFRSLSDSLGVGVGNAEEAVQEAALRNGATAYEDGTTLYGQASQELEGICRSTGLTWSIQDEQLQLLERGKPLRREALRLTSGTGLVGSPSFSSKGRLTAQTLMIPDLFPGRKIVMDSEFVKGLYRVDKCAYTGDTGGDDWGIRIEGRRTT